MALSDTQFQALKTQLAKKKATLGDEGYSSFIQRARSVPPAVAPTEESSATFAPSPTDSPVEAGLKSAGNVPSSAYGLGKNLVSAIASPIDTIKGISSAAVGAGGKLRDITAKGIDVATGTDVGTQALGGGKTSEAGVQTFDALKDSLLQRYGSLEAAQKTATEDPVGFGADVVGILSGVGLTRTVAPKIADINKAASAVVKSKVGGKLDDVALSQQSKALNLNPSDIRRIKQPNIANTSPEEWTLRRGFSGSQEKIVGDLDNYGVSTRTQVDEGLSALTKPVKATEAKAAQDTLQVLKNTFEGSIGNENLVSKLDEMLAKDQYTLSELNDIKRLADAELNIFKTTGVLKEGATAKGLFNVRDKLKTLIEDEATKQGFDTVKTLNKETQVAREISDSLKKRLEVAGKAPEFGLRDGVLAVGGLATGGIPVAAGLIISKKILESPQFRTFLAQKLKNAPEAKALEDAIKSRNYNFVLEYLAPVINEYENSQTVTQ